MTDFDYKKIVRESVEQDAETKEIKEDHLKHIEEISKHLSAPKPVLEVKRIHEGEVTVLGTIVSASEMYVLEEVDSGSITYKDAKSSIEYTLHAEQRSIERGIQKKVIEEILNGPVEEIYDLYEENHKCYGKEPAKDDRYIKIIYTKLNNNTLKVITVMITDKGGLRASGFSNL